MFRTIRAPISMLLLAGIAMIVPSQTADMLAALETTSISVWPTIAFHLALAMLAFSAWFWSRTLLAAENEVPDRKEARSEGHADNAIGTRPAYILVPRLLFILAVAIGAAIGLESGAWFNLTFVALWAALLGLGIVLRLNVAALRSNNATPLGPRIIAGKLTRRFYIGPTFDRLIDLIRWSPISPNLGIGMLVVPMAVFLLGSFEGMFGLYGLPAAAAEAFPGPSVGLLALALIMGPLSALTFVFDGVNAAVEQKAKTTNNLWWLLLRHPPVVTILIIWILVSPTLVSLHGVRIVRPENEVIVPGKRADLGTMFRYWARQCYAPSAHVQPIIVALSGGASRAGVWGERVLAEVDGLTGSAAPQIFAVTSVSGGSLAAAAYMSALASLPDAERCQGGQATPARRAQLRVLAAPQLSEDALGPVLAGAFLVDIPRALFAWALYGIAPPRRWIEGAGDYRPRGGDRAEALERGFEHLWKQTSHRYRGDHLIPFSAPYLSLFYEKNRQPRLGMPVWIANGTDSDTGNRLLTTPFASSTNWPFLAAKDVLGTLGADVPISTAINNTARFPYLDPVGELIPFDPSNQRPLFPMDHVPQTDGAADEIEDGGYFDNEGLQTALDLANWLQQAGPGQLPAGWPKPGNDPLHPAPPQVDPIIVLATSDGDVVPVETIPRCRPFADDPVSPAQAHRPLQILAPPLSLYALRGGHAAIIIREVRQEFCPNQSSPAYRCDQSTGLPVRYTSLNGRNQRFFHFYLPADGTTPVPLDWVLSERMARFIWNDALTRPGNKEEDWLMHQAFTADQPVVTHDPQQLPHGQAKAGPARPEANARPTTKRGM